MKGNIIEELLRESKLFIYLGSDEQKFIQFQRDYLETFESLQKWSFVESFCTNINSASDLGDSVSSAKPILDIFKKNLTTLSSDNYKPLADAVFSLVPKEEKERVYYYEFITELVSPDISRAIITDDTVLPDLIAISKASGTPTAQNALISQYKFGNPTAIKDALQTLQKESPKNKSKKDSVTLPSSPIHSGSAAERFTCGRPKGAVSDEKKSEDKDSSCHIL